MTMLPYSILPVGCFGRSLPSTYGKRCWVFCGRRRRGVRILAVRSNTMRRSTVGTARAMVPDSQRTENGWTHLRCGI